jgi:hypothetical protein
VCFGLRNINLWEREAREIKGEGWDDFGAAKVTRRTVLVLVLDNANNNSLRDDVSGWDISCRVGPTNNRIVLCSDFA